MEKLNEVIRLIGSDIYRLNNSQRNLLSLSKAYSLFPTYNALQNQITTSIKTKHVDLGLDALIDDKLKNGGDPFVTTSKLPKIDTTQLATKNDLEELKRSVGSAGGSNELKGQGFPYELNADIGTVYTDTTAKNGAIKWIKKTAGTGRFAWTVIAGDTKKFQPNNIQSAYGNSFVEFRRINSTVEIVFGGLSWGWFGIKRRGSDGYVPQASDKDRNVSILAPGGIPEGFRPTGSKLGIMTNDRGQRLGTWYVGGPTDKNHLRLQFDDPVPTDKDMTELRFTNMAYITEDPWPETL